MEKNKQHNKTVIASSTLPAAWMCSLSADYVFGEKTEICIEDVAHSLSHINRFTGHTLRPWSVAIHSLLVLRLCQKFPPKEIAGLQERQELEYCCLMHDGHESLASDLGSMHKIAVGQDWMRFEEDVEGRFHEQYGLAALMPRYKQHVKFYDLLALRIEREELLGEQGSRRPWPVLDTVHPGYVCTEWISAKPGEVRVMRDLERECLGFAPVVKSLFLDAYFGLRSAQT